MPSCQRYGVATAYGEIRRKDDSDKITPCGIFGQKEIKDVLTQMGIRNHLLHYYAFGNATLNLVWQIVEDGRDAVRRVYFQNIQIGQTILDGKEAVGCTITATMYE